MKDKSDAELLQIVTASKALVEPKRQVFDDDRVTISELDWLWEMAPRDAALAFARDHVGKEAADAVLKIADPNAQPPKSGEIGLRWISGNKYAPRTEGVTILKYDDYGSELRLSEVEIAGKASKAQIDAAVMKTDIHRLPPLVRSRRLKYFGGCGTCGLNRTEREFQRYLLLCRRHWSVLD